MTRAGVRATAVAAAACVAAASARAADPPERPKAAAVFRNDVELIDGVRAPWTIPHVLWDSEPEWRAAHPGPPASVAGIKMHLDAADVASLRKQAEEYLAQGASAFRGMRGGARSVGIAALDSLLEGGSKEQMWARFHREFADVVDGTELVYYRLDPPPRAAADPSAPWRGTWILEVEVQVRTEAAVRERPQDADVDVNELAEGIEAIRGGAKRWFQIRVRQAQEFLDTRIETLMLAKEPDLEEVAKCLAKKAELSKFAFRVEGDRPGHGDASSWIALDADGAADIPREVTFHLVVRRGVASVCVTGNLLGVAADGWRTTIDALARKLADMAAPFALEPR